MELDGYLNVLKPPGWTSHDVVARLRGVTGTRRIGHTGTLDPAAIGVLPVALGRATRTVSSPTWDDKEYLADIEFGVATDTDDAEGQAIATGDATALDCATVRAFLPSFVGRISQRPPAYSAVHVRGERAYHRARRGALDLPPERLVQIDAISVEDWRPPTLSIRITCHSGTYIRSIARDLGAMAGCPAHLAALVRLRVGPFGLGSTLDLAGAAAVAAENTWEQVIWPLDVATRHLGAIVVPAARTADMEHGKAWSMLLDFPDRTIHDGETASAYTANGAILGLVTGRNGWWQPARGLKPESVTVP